MMTRPKYSLARRMWLWPLALLVMIQPALAQTRTQNDSSLRVMVLDPRGAAITAARVRLSSETQVASATPTNARGEASFNRLAAGQYQLRVEADGFEPREQSVSLQPGLNQLEVRLEIGAVKEAVAVQQDKREELTDPRGNAFSTILTAEQIAQLPDDPDELEETLKAMAGPGATFFVNGFRGGKLPPKNQISQIRFRMNPYAAENHNSSFVHVDIFTKPGVDRWHGSFNAGFRDESLNARNAFAPFRRPEQMRRFSLDLGGPIWRDRSSLFLFADGASAYDTKTIVAALPDGPFSDLIRRPSRRLNFSARFEHALTKTHTFRSEYQRNANRMGNLGVGDFDLPERAFSTDSTEHLLRFADSGPLSKRTLNEFRFQARWQETQSRAVSALPAILVAGAFNRGGAQVNLNRRVNDVEIADNLDLIFGKHSMRVGGLFEVARYRSAERNNFNGTFTFASLAAFQAAAPTTFTQRFGEPGVEFTHYQFGWYWQDDLRVSKSLTLSYGLRHEVQSRLSDRSNFAPRFGLAWSPFKSGKTTIRTGGGIFYDWFGATTFEQTLRVDGQRQRDLVVRNPGFPDPLSGGTSIALPASRIVADPQLRMPYVQQASVSVQQQLPRNLMLSANYFHQRGVHLLRGRNINAPLAGVGRPDPASGNITQVESTANSSTHSLTFSLNWNQGRRLFLSAHYTLAQATNEADGPFSLPADNFNLRAERGPSPFDTRHRFFVLSNLTLFKGIRLGTNIQASSARPYNITTGFDNNGDTVSNDRPTGVKRNSARGAGLFDMSLRLSWGFGFGQIKESAVQGGPQIRTVRTTDGDVVSGGGGGSGGGPIGGGGMIMMTGSGASETPKRFRTEFYIQAYNLLNHTNLASFSGVQTSPFFGQATSAMPGRRIETGLRFSF
jgi:hypothetical protein